MLCELPPIDDPAVLVGMSTADDASVYRLDDQRALVLTVDLITPIVDDPYDYGRIAAANSLSDIYAMGARPLFALAVVCFPARKLGTEPLAKILQGGIAMAREAGICVAGGHSVEDREPKYGLAVMGLVGADRFLTNAGAQPGDVLVLTKPIGTGILSTALKKDRLDAGSLDRVVRVMTTLNRAAAAAIEGLDVHAVTDVTGFGLVGHLAEMAAASKVATRLRSAAVPVLDGVWPLAREGIHPGGTRRNLEYFGTAITWQDGTDDPTRVVLADPQTSGGLLIAVAEHHVDTLLDRLDFGAVIGCIEAGPAGTVQVE